MTAIGKDVGETAVTPEMIEAGVQASGQWFMDARRNDRVEAAIYLAMKALDPEIERLRLLLSCAQTYVKLVAENGKSTIAEELFFDIKRALSQTQPQAPDSRSSAGPGIRRRWRDGRSAPQPA